MALPHFSTSPRKTLRVWSGWGFDYYGDESEPSSKLLSAATKELLNEVGNPPFSMIKLLSKSVLSMLQNKAASRTDYFSAPIPSDLDVFKTQYSNFNGDYAQLNYVSVAENFSQGSKKVIGSNILVGNSASPSGNHIDVFNMLAKHDLRSRKVIVPLSYGDSAYRISVLAAGKKILGDSFVPLDDFMPFNEYREVVANCNIVIMNHYRQQALGNIGAAMFQGAHVYLSSVSPTYKFFNEKGAFIHSMKDLECNALPLGELTIAAIAKNRDILEEFWGDVRINFNVNNLVNKIK